jgi:peptide/nickel transport system permease protein
VFEKPVLLVRASGI